MGNQYGYIRVSSREQNEDRQRYAMYEQGIEKQNIFLDKQSGKDFDRPQYTRLMQKLKAGDIVFLHAIDRLGRNYEEVLEQWRIITKEKGADIVVLDMPLLNTKKQKTDLTGTFISDLVLQILSYVAQAERENIKKRQAEGIAAAQAKGVHFGRKEKQLPDNFKDVIIEWRRKKYSGKVAADKLGISRTLLYKKAKELDLL